MAVVTRKDLANAIWQRMDCLSRADSMQLISEVIEEMIEAINEDGALELCDLGTFKLLAERAQRGKASKTKEPALVTSIRTLHFYPAPTLLAALNGDLPDGTDQAVDPDKMVAGHKLCALPVKLPGAVSLMTLYQRYRTGCRRNIVGRHR
jgi:nucleoid DNA-binding protein